jgi:hypothetical protein
MPENFRPNRRTALAMAIAVTAAALSTPARAEGGVTVFKIVTPKDDMFVGLTAEELEKLGAGASVEVLAKKIAAEGQMTLWQYGVKHGEQGQLVFAPIGRVSVFAAGVVRIEPYKAAYEVIAPTP